MVIRYLALSCCLFLCVEVSFCQDDYSLPFQSSITVPIGTLLPVEHRNADALLKLALQRHNAFPATLASQWGTGQPSLRYQVFLQNAPANNSFRLAQEFCTHISHRVHSIIGAWDDSSASAMISYCEAFQIPWITPSFLTDAHIPSEYVVSLHPKLEKFILCFIQTFNLKRITYVYDERELHLPLKTLLHFGVKYKFQLTVRNVNRKKNLLPMLREIAYKEEYNLLFDVKINVAERILQQIAAIGMMTVEYMYLFLDLGVMNLDMPMYMSGSAKLYFISFTDETSPQIGSVQRDLRKTKEGRDVKITDEAALVYDAFTAMALGMTSISERNYVFNQQLRSESETEETKLTCHQIPIVPLTTGYDIVRAIKKVKFKGLTGNVQFDDRGSRTNFDINLHAFASSGVRKVGLWSDDPNNVYGTLVINGSMTNVKTLDAFRNRTLIVTTILEEPYVMLKKNWKTLEGNDRFHGYCVDLLKEITKIAPLQYRIKPVDDGQYGSKNEKDGMWNGMIGEVKYQKAHMAVAPLTITSAREAVVDFTKPFMSLGISIMIKKPEKQTPNIFSFLEPLSNEIWICIGFAYTGVSVVLYLVSRLSPYEWHKGALSNAEQEEEADSVTDFGIMNSLWFSLGAFVQQGCDISPKSFSGRIVGGVWWFFTLIIISSYTANLAAFLTVDRMVSPISGAEDLAKQNVIKYGTLQSGSTVNFFKQSPLPTYEKMWGSMKSQDPSVFVASNREGIERVRKSNGKYAFLMESTLNDYTEQRRPCNTMKVGPNIDAKGYGIALPKGSPLYDTVNLAILTLREKGHLQKMKNYWWYDKSECGPNGNNAPTKTPALMLSNVAGVFYILIAGMILAVLMSIIEYSYEAVVTRHDKKKKLHDDGSSDTRASGIDINIQSLDIPNPIYLMPQDGASHLRR